MGELILKILCCLAMIAIGTLTLLSMLDVDLIKAKRQKRKRNKELIKKYNSLTKNQKELFENIITYKEAFENSKLIYEFTKQLKPITSRSQMIEQLELGVKSASNVLGYETTMKYVDENNKCHFIVSPKQELLEYEIVLGPVPNIATIDHNEPFR